MIRTMFASAVLLAACAHARTADEYRTATATALATQNDGIKACYDRVLATTPAAGGRVTVTFTVEPKTGRIVDAQIDHAKTTAPDEVSHCVLASIPAVAIQPGDPKRGDASWSWDLQPGAPAKTP